MASDQKALAAYNDGTPISVGDRVSVNGKAGKVLQVVAPFPQPIKPNGEVDFDRVEWRASVELDGQDAHGRIVTLDVGVDELEQA